MCMQLAPSGAGSAAGDCAAQHLHHPQAHRLPCLQVLVLDLIRLRRAGAPSPYVEDPIYTFTFPVIPVFAFEFVVSDGPCEREDMHPLNIVAIEYDA